ncbi:MAG TPA: Dabb family protein [Vicinamibacterales bacterium]|nr:Dabb family protein [Vicinamibacterales bacterium]
MIVHVILFRPRSDLPMESRQAVLEGLSAAAVDIPTIRRLRVGRRVLHGRAGYEQRMTENFEYAVIVEFDDVEGLTAYLSHPSHKTIGDHFTQSSTAALAYDYEMIDLK